jgi:cytochrome P450
MGLPRIAPRGGVTIGDRTLPEGTIVSVNPWVMHHSTELWGADAHTFNPDRWLGKDAALREKYWVSVSTCVSQAVCILRMQIRGAHFC